MIYSPERAAISQHRVKPYENEIEIHVHQALKGRNTHSYAAPSGLDSFGAIVTQGFTLRCDMAALSGLITNTFVRNRRRTLSCVYPLLSFGQHDCLR